MKRSDMVKVIEKAMRCWNGAYFNQSLESHILEYIEEAGMLPPKSLDTVCVKKGLVRGYTTMFEWEPEDE